MIVEKSFKQRTPEWHWAKLGIPSASSFDRILTPKTLKPSTQAKDYMMKLLAEWLTGIPHNEAASGFMDRGTKLEEEALRWYEYEHDLVVERVGLVLADDRMVACSPDGLVGEEGGLEIKCPSASTHVDYLLNGLDEYRGQVQGALWLTERKWWDLVSYCPGLPKKVVRFEPDPEYAEAMEKAMGNFLSHLQLSREHLARLGCKPAKHVSFLMGRQLVDPMPF